MPVLLLHVTSKIVLEAKRHVLCVQLQRAFVFFSCSHKVVGTSLYCKSLSFFTENASNCRIRETKLYCSSNLVAARNSKDAVG